MKISIKEALTHDIYEYRVAADYWSRDFRKVEQCGYKNDKINYDLVQQILDENYVDWFDEMINGMEKENEEDEI